MITLTNLQTDRTIKREVRFSGNTPYLDNHETTIILKPFRNGIRFMVPKDGDKRIIPVNAINNISTLGVHSTFLESNGAVVKLTEHLLSALTGMGITSCEIELIGSNQVPVPDRCSRVFCKHIQSAGIMENEGFIKIAKVTKDIFFTDNNGSLAILRPSKIYEISALLQYKNIFEDQYLKINVDKSTYWNEIMWARSFIRSDCKNNKDWTMVTKTLKSLPKDIKDSPVMVRSNGNWITGIKPLEPVRHKILDAIGDLTTLGYPLMADVTLIRPGHEFNRKLVHYLWKLIKTPETS